MHQHSRSKSVPGRENALRAARALRAVAKYRDDYGLTAADGLDTAVTDLICDLQHLCDRKDLGFESILHMARIHYRAETDHGEEGPGVERRGLARATNRQGNGRKRQERG
jgi:hypothetical protein